MTQAVDAFWLDSRTEKVHKSQVTRTTKVLTWADMTRRHGAVWIGLKLDDEITWEWRVRR